MSRVLEVENLYVSYGMHKALENIIINLLKSMRDDGKTIFIIHHDLTKAKDYFDELILLDRELIGAGPLETVLKPNLLEDAYGAPLSLFETTD